MMDEPQVTNYDLKAEEEARAAIRQAHLALCDTVRYHDRLYYREGKPEITDREYDVLFRKLTNMEDDHPWLVTPDSPTQSPGH